MGEFTLEVEIDAPQTEVFDFIADPAKTPQWYEAVRSVEPLGDGAPRPGARYRFLRELPQGPVTNEVEIVEYERPRRVAFASRSGPTPFRYRYSVTPSERGSTVTLDAEITGEGLRGPAAVLAPFAAKFFARGMAKNLDRLKARVEA